MERYKYRIEDVVDTWGPELAVRNFYEQRDLARILAHASQGTPLKRGADVGAGHGRMTVVLSEFCEEVHGFEREPELVECASRLNPAARFHQISSLGHLPCPDKYFDFVFTFTVLQHLSDDALGQAAAEIRRICSVGGWVLLCEETDPALSISVEADAQGHFTVGRSLEQYQARLPGFRLEHSLPRKVEPTYFRQDVGTYMLFRREEA
jgi:SAM-dependent methyltransferase